MANNEKVQISLDFKANTQQAQQAINQLQTNLSKIAMEGSSIRVDSASLNQASEAAKKLSIHLNNAYNSSTGKLDLSKFHKSLKQGQDSVKSLSVELLKAGSTGQQAFVQLSQSIAQAERPVITISNRLSKLGETLKNTVRWQISTSILQGFTGAIQKAYSYTKDLNKNLNDIRIVTGYSADRMADFAKEANKAAKALSSSTNEYAKASLIYFQQGLSDQEVKERTDATIKMANVTGQAAQEVSDQMTAIWNNFDNGSKSLEYYADVITALGAATASSSEEISEGLNKFAAVAETVGLSYEYAASALATVTATTRQSADTVGTAFKTLFARIQDLELGNTLDDGTTLGQYSEALAKVGINIKDSSGQMKDMNNILDEMGSKWNTLSKDTQVAVAQSVAGVRQYTQLIALMDNWDFFQQNLSTATGAEGTLNKQFAIYEQSWKAASKRMQASAEALYDKLLDDEFFIKLTDGLGSFLDSIGAIIDGLGGMKGVLISVSGILTQMFAGKIQQGIQNLAHNFSIMMGGAAKAHAEITQQMTAANAAAMSNPNLSDESKQQLTSANQLMAMKERIGVLGDSLSEAEKQRYEQEIQIIETHQKENLALQQKLTSQKAIVAEIKKELELLKEEPMEESDLGGDAEALRKIAGQEKMKAIRAGQGPGGKEYNQAQAQLQHFETLDNTRQSFTKTLMDRYDEAQFDSELKGTPKDITYDFVRAGKENGVQSIKDNFIISGKGYAKGGAFDFMRPDSKQKPLDDSTISAAKAALEQLQKDMEAITSGAAPELKAAIDSALKAKTDASLKKRIEGVRKALTQVKIEGQNVGKVLKTNLGQEKHVTKVTKKVKELNEEQQKTIKIQEDLEKNTEKINKAVKNFNPQHIMGGTEAFLKLTGAASGAVMGVQQLINLVDVWNNQDLSIGEKITSTIMALTMGVPMILQAVGSMKQFGQAVTAARAAQALLTQAINDENVASALSLALSEKEAGAISEETMKKLQQTLVEKGLATETNKQAMANEFLAKTKLKATAAGKAKAAGDLVEAGTSKVVEGATKSQTGAVVANTAAWYTNPITAIIAVAMLAVAGAVLAVTSGMKANSEAIQENSKKTTEHVEKTREEVKTHGELVQSYRSLLVAYNETGEGKEELASVTQDLANIYNIEGAALASLTGDYDGFTAALDKARQKEIALQQSLEKGAQVVQNRALVDSLREGTGWLNGNTYQGDFGNGHFINQSGIGSDEAGIDHILESGNYKYLQYASDGDINFRVNAGDPKAMYEYYLELQRLEEEIHNSGLNLSKSELYEEITAELAEGAENFASLQASVKSVQALEQEELIQTTTFANDKNVSDITNVQDYQQFKDSYIKNYEKTLQKQGIEKDSQLWTEAMQQANESLALNENFAQYETLLKGVEDLNVAENIKDDILALSEEDKSTLWTLNLNKEMAMEDIENLIDEAQQFANDNEIKLSFEAKNQALELFNKGQWDELEQFFAKNQNALGMTFEQFSLAFHDDLQGARDFLTNHDTDVTSSYFKNEADIKNVSSKVDYSQQRENDFETFKKANTKERAKLRSKYKNDSYFITAINDLEVSEKAKKDYEERASIFEAEKYTGDHDNYFDINSNSWGWDKSDDDNKVLANYAVGKDKNNIGYVKFGWTGYNTEETGIYNSGNLQIGSYLKTGQEKLASSTSYKDYLKSKGIIYNPAIHKNPLTDQGYQAFLAEQASLKESLSSPNNMVTGFNFSEDTHRQAEVVSNIINNGKLDKDSESFTLLNTYLTQLKSGASEDMLKETKAKLDSLTDDRFSQALNQLYTFDESKIKYDDQGNLILTNDIMEETIEGENGFLQTLYSAVQYGVYKEDLKEKSDTAGETAQKSATALVQETKKVEDRLKSLYQTNMSLMLQREQQIKDQGLEISEWKALQIAIVAQSESLKEGEKASAQQIWSAGLLAENLLKQRKALDSLTTNWESYIAVLNDSTSSTIEQAEALGKMAEAIAALLGLDSSDKISQSWLRDTKNQDIIYTAMTSSHESDQASARAAYAKAILGNFTSDERAMTEIINLLEKDYDGQSVEEISSKLSNILRGEVDHYDIETMDYNSIQSLLSIFGIGAVSASSSVAADKVTKQEDGTYKVEFGNGVTRFLNAEDVVASDFKETEVEEADGTTTKTQEATQYTVRYLNAPQTYKDDDLELNLYDLDYQISEMTRKLDTSKYTTFLNYQLEQAEKRLEKLNSQADKLSGKKRIEELERYGETLRESFSTNGLLDTSLSYAKTEAYNMRKILGTYAKETGNNVQITPAMTEEEVIKAYQSKITELVNKGDADSLTKAENLNNYLNNYIDALNEVNEIEQQMQDKRQEWQENNFKIITEKYELDDETEEEILENYDKIIEKAEKRGIDGLSDIIKSRQQKNKLLLTDNAEQEAKIQELVIGYENGDILQSDYIEGLTQARDKIKENNEVLEKNREQISETYIDMLSKASEEIERYTNKLDHNISVLDHLYSTLELIGSEKDYTAFGEILSGQSEAALKDLEIAEGELNTWEQMLKDLEAEKDFYTEEEYNRMYDETLAKRNKAQQEALEKTQKWAEAEKAVLENNFKSMQQTLQKAMIGDYLSFDDLNTDMERKNSLQEEYLTTTNKIYETTKMIRTAQNEIDKTTNTVAKQRLKAFQEETKNLQSKNNLSKFELDIQQAKYDLLLAEIALEEAQNAKSQVRLRRDSEGNFGYVYTADQANIANAQQQYEDAENALYNARLDGANTYMENYQSTMQEFYDTLTELQETFLNGGFASEEEYNNAVEAAKSYYYEKLAQYSELYAITVQDDQRIIAESWSGTFNTVMEQSSKNLNEAIDSFKGGSAVALGGWYDVVKTVREKTGLEVGNINSTIGSIVTECDKVKKALLGDPKDKENKGVLGAIKTVSESVLAQGNSYNSLSVTVDGVKKSYSDFLTVLTKVNTELQYFKNNPVAMGDSPILGSGVNGWQRWNANLGTLYRESDMTKGIGEIKAVEGAVLYAISGATRKVVKGQPVSRTVEEGENFMSGDYIDLKNGYLVHKDDPNLRFKVVTYDTGGYTGSWGPEGKWAMLHQKEIVLNAQDTENLLAAVDILRQIVSVIDIQSQYNQLANTLIPSVSSYNNNGIEQNVHIEASFPSVTDHNEIELALRNIVNEASQYINRK